MPQQEKEPTDEWRERERKRFEDGVYDTLPPQIRPFYLANPRTKDHFAHPDLEGKGMIAFTEDERRGIADTQKRMKTRRYFNTYFSEFLQASYSYSKSGVESLIEEWAKAVAFKSVKVEVLFAMNPDHIRWVLSHSRNINDVYENDNGDLRAKSDGDLDEEDRGCPSCMTYDPEGSKPHSTSGYICRPIMPCEIMGYGDLAIAHIISPTNPNLVKARVVCWPAKKIRIGTIYGRDGWEERLNEGLGLMGYSIGRVTGAKMHLWYHNGIPIAPYLDGDNGLYVYKGYPSGDLRNYVEITYEGEGEWTASQINGVACEALNSYCSYCDQHIHEQDMSGNISAQSGEELCTTCYEEDHFRCDNCEEVYTTDDLNNVVDEYWCSDCVDADAFTCQHCNETLHNDNGCNEDKDGDNICSECVNTSDEYTFMDSGCVGVITKEIVTTAKCTVDCCDIEELSREEA